MRSRFFVASCVLGGMLVGCVTVEPRMPFVVTEVYDESGIVVHQDRTRRRVAFGQPQWDSNSVAKGAPYWRVSALVEGDTARNAPRGVAGGAVSTTGLIALARRSRNLPRIAGRIDVCQLVDGRKEHEIAVDAAAVAWSRDGGRLALLEYVYHQNEPAQEHAEALPNLRISTWTPAGGVKHIADLSFGTKYSEPIQRMRLARFALGWSPDERFVVVSTRTLPTVQELLPRGAVVDVESGRTYEFNASDAYYVGPNRIVALDEGWAHRAVVLSLMVDALVVVQHLPAEIVPVAANADLGTFLAFSRPKGIFKGYAFPVAWFDAAGNRLASFGTGFSTSSTRQIFSRDEFPCPELLPSDEPPGGGSQRLGGG